MPMYKPGTSFKRATGKVQYNMTNDYMFHYVLQRDTFALKGLISSLLHLDAEDIESVTIENPVMLGETIKDKESILDILVRMNDETLINLEMQVHDHGNWVPRSIHYLCREYTSIDHGDDYSDAGPAYHIGFLDYTLFPDHPEFYGVYRLRNVRDNYEYSGNFTLGVVELKHVDLATDEDRAYDIDKWVRLFKATSWEDLKMIAQKNTYINSAAQTMYAGNVDQRILALCRKTDEEIRGDENRRKRIVELDKIVAEQNDLLVEKNNMLTEKDSLIAEKDDMISEKDSLLAEQEKRISNLEDKIAELTAQLASLSL